ncbi:TadE family type IV pilus minor pilin [Propionibacteriaceae bacterium Y1685]
MVTAELAMGIIAVVILVLLLSGAGSLLVVQMGCLDSASEIARQTARGDQAAVEKARADVPSGAVVTVDRTSEAVRVEVGKPVHLLPALPAFTVRAEATTLLEPGE